MPRTTTLHAVTAIGIDMGKNTLHLIGLDARGAIVLREKVARGRIALRLANLPPCLIGIEAGMATHYVAREVAALGHDVKQVPATYAKPFRQGHKNDFRDAHAVAEAVQRPTTRFVPAKTNEQLDLQALHRVRSRLVSERTAVINQIRGFLLERGIDGSLIVPTALSQIVAASSWEKSGAPTRSRASAGRTAASRAPHEIPRIPSALLLRRRFQAIDVTAVSVFDFAASLAVFRAGQVAGDGD